MKALKKTVNKLKARWWIALAVLFTALEIGLPFLSDDLPRYLFGVLSALFGSCAFATRLIATSKADGN
jgi:hypothetical protein